MNGMSKPTNKSVKRVFKKKDWVVYPAHGVGKVVGIEEQEISGTKLELYVVEFEREKMTLRVPLDKVEPLGMRKLSTKDEMGAVVKTLKGKAKVKRTIWSRRAQEYTVKLNSGCPVSVAEVLRDLHRRSDQPEQSYSERQLYEAALDRLAREFAAVEKIEHETAEQRIEDILLKVA